MYFVISVLPLSIASGALPPASVASNLARWVGQVWYWTFTVVPGCCFWNAAFAAATTPGHPDCASTWSQTVMLAADRLVAPVALVATATHRIAARTAAPMMRAFIEDLPFLRDGPRALPGLRDHGGSNASWSV